MGSYGIILFVALVVLVFVLRKKGIMKKGAQAVLDKANPVADKIHEGMDVVGDKVDAVADTVKESIEAKIEELKK